MHPTEQHILNTVLSFETLKTLNDMKLSDINKQTVKELDHEFLYLTKDIQDLRKTLKIFKVILKWCNRLTVVEDSKEPSAIFESDNHKLQVKYTLNCGYILRNVTPLLRMKGIIL
jgi:ribosomal protein S2